MLALRLHVDPGDERVRLAAAKDGDADALTWLVRRWTPGVYRFVFRMLNNEEDARDITQETFTRAIRNLNRYDIKRPFSTWVYRIARNACIDKMRKRKHRPSTDQSDIADSSASPLELAVSARRSERLHRALEEMPPKYREIIILYHFEHLKYCEIGEILNVPLGTVMNRIFRARQKLRTIYESLGGDA